MLNTYVSKAHLYAVIIIIFNVFNFGKHTQEECKKITNGNTSLYSQKKKLLPPPLSLKIGRKTTKELTALEIPNLVYKLPFR